MEARDLTVREEEEVFEEMAEAFAAGADDLLEDLAPRNGGTFGPTGGDVLGLVRDADGLTHAAYPDALRTLCSRPTSTLEPAAWNGCPPECEPCKSTARRYDFIDSSAPAEWFRSGKRWRA